MFYEKFLFRHSFPFQIDGINLRSLPWALICKFKVGCKKVLMSAKTFKVMRYEEYTFYSDVNYFFDPCIWNNKTRVFECRF